MTDKKKLDCSFCGKDSSLVKKLIEGPEVYICDACVYLCHGMLIQSSTKAIEPLSEKAIPSPKKIKMFLDQYVIGQHDAKEFIAVSVYNHYKRLANPVIGDVEIDKSNILLIGPTGSGKTLIAQSLARILDVPFTIADATSLTETGYVGDDVEIIITRLLQNAEFDIKRAERGIIFLDEIDKKAKRDSSNSTRDVSGEGVQQALLKLVEGTEVRVANSGSKRQPNQEISIINTKNILFICSGAFVGLDTIVEKRMNIDIAGTIGFNSKAKVTKPNFEQIWNDIEPQDLMKYGLIPEFVSRFPCVVGLLELTEDQLISVMTEPKNALVKQYQAMFRIEKIGLDFDPDALKEVAKIAHERGTGARGLRAIIEHKLRKTQFELPDLASTGVTNIIIHKESITDNTEPERVSINSVN